MRKNRTYYRSRLFRLIGILAVVFGLTTGIGTAPAYAQQQQVCGNGGSGYCMNDWNALNQYVKMYNGGVSNEDFGFRDNATECGSGYVTSIEEGLGTTNCPFQDAALDANYSGDTIGQIEYYPTHQCIGTTSAGTAWLGNCANSDGVGGGTGSTMIYDNEEVAGIILVDRYWSDYYSSGSEDATAYVTSGGSSGAYLYVNDLYGYTEWGGI
jgi:hypothetical protein